MTPVAARVCRSLRRESEVRSSMLETSRWPGHFPAARPAIFSMMPQHAGREKRQTGQPPCVRIHVSEFLVVTVDTGSGNIRAAAQRKTLEVDEEQVLLLIQSEALVERDGEQVL